MEVREREVTAFAKRKIGWEGKPTRPAPEWLLGTHRSPLPGQAPGVRPSPASPPGHSLVPPSPPLRPGAVRETGVSKTTPVCQGAHHLAGNRFGA